MAKKLIEMLQPEILGKYYEKISVDDEPFVGEALFPAKKQIGLDLSFIKGADNNTVLLKPSAFDSIAEVRTRLNAETMTTEMPLFRESMIVGEKEKQQYYMLMNNPNANEFLKSTLRKIYDDVANLVRSARRVNERMRMELLSTGKISIGKVTDGIGSAYDYDYTNPDFTSDNMQTLTGNAKWSDSANATPLADLRRWQQSISTKTGTKPTIALMSSKVLQNMMNTAEVKNHLTALNGGSAFITESTMKNILLSELGITVLLNDKKYTDYDGSQKNYYPDNKVTLLPAGELGNTVFAYTNEEMQLTSGVNQSVAVVDTGVAILSVIEPHPVNEKVFVAEIALPTFERMNQIFIAKVID